MTPDEDVREAYPAIDRAFADGWNDPRMDDYDRYDDLARSCPRGSPIKTTCAAPTSPS